MPPTMEYSFQDNPNLQWALPEALAAAVKCHPNWAKHAETALTMPLLETLLRMAPALHMPVPYHNRHHPPEVDALLQRLLDAVQVRDTLRGWLRVVAHFHDVCHPGIRYRQYLSGIPYPQLSAEEFSAHVTAQLLLRHAVPVREVMLVVALIHSSSFQQAPHEVPRRDLARPYGRHQPLEDLFHVADILANIVQGVRPWFFASLAVHIEEMHLIRLQNPQAPWPSFDAWLDGEEKFVAYSRGYVNKVVPYLTSRLRQELNDAIDAVEQFLVAMQRGSTERKAYARHYAAAEQVHEQYHLGMQH